MSDLVERLRERRKLKYMADCKCGKCQCVHIDDVYAAADGLQGALSMLERVSHLNSFRELNGILPYVRALLVELGTKDAKVIEMHREWMAEREGA